MVLGLVRVEGDGLVHPGERLQVGAAGHERPHLLEGLLGLVDAPDVDLGRAAGLELLQVGLPPGVGLERRPGRGHAGEDLGAERPRLGRLPVAGGVGVVGPGELEVGGLEACGVGVPADPQDLEVVGALELLRGGLERLERGAGRGGGLRRGGGPLPGRAAGGGRAGRRRARTGPAAWRGGGGGGGPGAAAERAAAERRRAAAGARPRRGARRPGRRGRRRDPEARRAEPDELGLGEEQDHPAQRVGVGGVGGAELVDAPDAVDPGDGAGLLRVEHQVRRRSIRPPLRGTESAPRTPSRVRTTEGSMWRTASARSPQRLPTGKPDGGGATFGSQRQVPSLGGERPPHQAGAVLLQFLEVGRRVEQAQVDEGSQQVAPQPGRDLAGVGGGLGGELAPPDEEGGQVVLLPAAGGVLDHAAPVGERPGQPARREREAPRGLGGRGQVVQVEGAPLLE